MALDQSCIFWGCCSCVAASEWWPKGHAWPVDKCKHRSVHIQSTSICLPTVPPVTNYYSMWWLHTCIIVCTHTHTYIYIYIKMGKDSGISPTHAIMETAMWQLQLAIFFSGLRANHNFEVIWLQTPESHYATAQLQCMQPGLVCNLEGIPNFHWSHEAVVRRSHLHSFMSDFVSTFSHLVALWNLHIPTHDRHLHLQLHPPNLNLTEVA